MNYRNKKLLKLAQEIPSCTMCGCYNKGNIVAAHSNQIIHGKGKGIKAHDFAIAFICNNCHYEIDHGQMDKQDKIERWTAAFFKTIEWLFLNEKLIVRG